MSLIILGILFCFYLYCKYRVFEKAYQKGYKAILPIIDKYTLCSFSWRIEMFYVYLFFLILFIGSIMGLYMDIGFTTILYVSSLSSYIVLIIIHILLQYKLAKFFQLPLFYRLGMVVLYPIFLCILAFKKELV